MRYYFDSLGMRYGWMDGCGYVIRHSSMVKQVNNPAYPQTNQRTKIKPAYSNKPYPKAKTDELGIEDETSVESSSLEENHRCHEGKKVIIKLSILWGGGTASFSAGADLCVPVTHYN